MSGLYNHAMTKKPEPASRKSAATDTPTPLRAVRDLLLKPMAGLPARLVVLLGFSLVVAAITALAMLQLEKKRDPGFMPQRLEAQAEAAPLADAALQGIWTTDNDNAAMTLTLTQNKFEWIIQMKDDGSVRYFIRGNYRIVGDVLILGGRNDMGNPADGMIRKDKYLPFSFNDMNVFATTSKNKMSWTIPKSEQDAFRTRSTDIFDTRQSETMVWSRMK